VKAIIVAAMHHLAGEVNLRGVVCNGGAQPERRAKLARCLLDQIGAPDIPVGIGSAGKEHIAGAHEFDFDGIDGVDDSRLHDGVDLLLSALVAAEPHSLSFLLISSLRDFADCIIEHEELVLAKVQTVAIMGGLTRESPQHAWKPDTSMNNYFDIEAAELVYRWCFENGVPMRVTSRHAVPMLPMGLACSFADVSDSTVMKYLYNCQCSGLVTLWHRLCLGQAPQRCTKEWFVQTFCGAFAGTTEELCSKMEDVEDISTSLNGHVKPYDVVALMTLLPRTRDLFKETHTVNGVAHTLLLSEADILDVSHVVQLLSSAYKQVLVAEASVRLSCMQCLRRLKATRPQSAPVGRTVGSPNHACVLNVQ
jgi:hypothetical protein